MCGAAGAERPPPPVPSRARGAAHAPTYARRRGHPHARPSQRPPRRPHAAPPLTVSAGPGTGGTRAAAPGPPRCAIPGQPRPARRRGAGSGRNRYLRRARGLPGPLGARRGRALAAARHRPGANSVRTERGVMRAPAGCARGCGCVREPCGGRAGAVCARGFGSCRHRSPLGPRRALGRRKGRRSKRGLPCFSASFGAVGTAGKW